MSLPRVQLGLVALALVVEIFRSGCYLLAFQDGESLGPGNTDVARVGIFTKVDEVGF